MASKIGLNQTRGIGDIIIALPIADFFIEQGHEVFWPVDARFVGFFQQAKPAIVAYRRILEDEPDHPGSNHFLGVILCQTGKQSDGLPYLYRSIALSPHVASFHANLGAILGRMGRTEEALAAFQQSVRLNPKHFEGHVNLVLKQANLPSHFARFGVVLCWRSTTTIADFLAMPLASVIVLWLRVEYSQTQSRGESGRPYPDIRF